MKYILSVLVVLFAGQVIAQNTIADTYWNAHQKSIIDHYKTFLSIPNVTRDTPNIRKNAAFIQQWMKELGIETKLLEGITPGVTPAVYGKVTVPGATRTIAFYAHYDGQPVNPKQWGTGLDPFTPVFITAPYERGGKIIQLPDTAARVPENWRISGRGSADDKAGVMTILHAYAALKEQKAKLSQNIVFFFEGEEEMGSTHIGEIFERNKSLLNADLWVISDGPRHVSGRKMVVFGVRGDMNMALTVYGPKRPLHSGNYGNWAPNPARMLVELLAGMKDENNRVTIKGFYDDVVPLTETEKKAIAAIPDIETTLKKDLGIVQPEGNGASFLELLSLPTLNINGISSGNTGAMAANIIPVKAEAALDLRLVLGNDLNRQVEKVKAHIRSRGYTILDHDPSDEERLKYEKIIKISVGDGYNAQRTPMDLPLAQFVIKAVQASSKEPIVLQPSAGGSLPLIVFEQKLGAKVLTVPVVNFDNNQHAENENVRIDYLREGIGTMVSIMSGN
ncbi:MAG: M20/M25/M40 family metallo-hydrolase [Chitinophagaceae bacterium]|nr:M20/M25/M40 family metallo-hydrolase [Chitinophagaceae bacterium]